MSFSLTGRQLISGEWIAASDKTFHAVNPASGDTLQPAFHHASDSDVDAAMKAAERAFTTTRDLPVERRVQLLESVAAQIMALGDELLHRAHAETGLPLARLTGERARTCNQVKHFADVLRDGSWLDATIDTAEPQRQPLPKPDLRRTARPIGPVVVFGAGNFPFAYGACGGDTASALAAGNPVVVKAHERHPGTNELFAHAMLAALRECDLPPEIFGLVQGPGATVGQALVKHPTTQAVGFTGSQRAGRTLFDIAAARPQPIPVFAEMGSVNPIVLLPSALTECAETIAAGLAQSITMGAGQFCTKPGLVFVLDGTPTDNFIAQLTKHIAAIPPSTMLAADMRRNFCSITDGFAKLRGVKTHSAGDASGFAAMSPRLYETDSATWRANVALHEEAFGPGAVLVRCSDIADLMAAVALAGGNLTATIHAGSTDLATDVRYLLSMLEQQAGRVVFNGFPTGVEVCAAMIHGGPYPATTAPATTSVGALAIQRFVRPVSFQNVPDALLPVELQNANPRGIWRTINGQRSRNLIQA